MENFLVAVLNLAVPVFAATSMLAVGFSYSTWEIVAPLRRVHAVVRTLVANFVLVPLLTYLVLQVFPLDRPLMIGLFLVASAAGSAFLVKLVQLARGDLALSATVLVLLLLVTIIYMPVVVPLVFPEAEVSAAAIAGPLVATMLLPLGIGHFVEARYRAWADRLQPIARKTSSVALIVVIAATFLVHFEAILTVLGTGAIMVSILVIGGAFVIGFLLGGSRPEVRTVVGLGTGQRNIAAAIVVATQGFRDPDILVMVVVFSIVGIVVLFPLAWILRRVWGKEDVISV